MFNGRELKERARTVLKGSYWSSLPVALIMMMVSGDVSIMFSVPSGSADTSQLPGYGYLDVSPVLLLVFFVVIIMATLIAIGLSIFVYNPLLVGGKRFFIRAGGGHEVQFSNLGYCFKNGYGNVVKTMFMKNLFIFFWSLIALIPLAIIFGIIIAAVLMQSAYTGGDLALYNAYIRELSGYTMTGNQLIGVISMLLPVIMLAAMIPAIIAKYRYWMVEYILAEDPYMPWREVLRKSKELMHKNKWETYVLELSFIGWNLLGMCACGVGVVFVRPYMEATFAQLYLCLTNRFYTEPTDGYIPYVS